MVQLEDQGDGRREFILSYVCVPKSSRARKGPYRRIFSGGRLGHTSVRIQDNTFLRPDSRGVVANQILRNPSLFAPRLRLPCTLVRSVYSWICHKLTATTRLRQVDQEPQRSPAEAEPVEQRRPMGVQKSSYVDHIFENYAP
jgi:hypothetical protein